MSNPRSYVIRRAFVFPLGLLILLTLALLAVCVLQHQPLAKVIILGFLILPLLVLFIESFLRRIDIDTEGVTARRPLRSKRVLFKDVTGLETVQVRSRVFLTLMAGNDEFLIISNSYARFPELLTQLIKAVPEGTVTDETRQLAAAPKTRQADIVTAWFAVCALVYVLLAQFLR